MTAVLFKQTDVEPLGRLRATHLASTELPRAASSNDQIRFGLSSGFPRLLDRSLREIATISSSVPGGFREFDYLQSVLRTGLGAISAVAQPELLAVQSLMETAGKTLQSLTSEMPEWLEQLDRLGNVTSITELAATELKLVTLSSTFVMDGAEEVAEFLRRHEALMPVLLEAAPVLAGLFGNDTPLRLSLFTDPEADDARALLFILVRTGLSVPEARARLDTFEEEWLLDRLEVAGGSLNVALEYV